jgi:hypothetical protein
MATKLTSYLFRIPLVILRIILEDVCTQLIALRPFYVLIKSLSSTKLIGLRSLTFALFLKHAVMSLSTCSSAACQSMIAALLRRVSHQKW